MSATRRDVLILLAVAVLLGAMAYFAFPLTNTNLGLDLQGGLAVVLEAQDTSAEGEDDPRTPEAMDQAVQTIEDRVNRLGVAEPEIQRQGDYKISVQLPGIEDQARALEIIGKTALLEFYWVQDFGAAYDSREAVLAAAGVEREDDLPAGYKIIHWPGEERYGYAENPDQYPDEYYVTGATPELTGSNLKDAGFDMNQRSNLGGGTWYVVTMEFDNEGAEIFRELTRDLAEIGEGEPQPEKLAIVLDGEVKSAPQVTEEIPGGKAEITGRFTLQDAKDLALVLDVGRLPVELEVVTQNEIGATLGKTALTQALIAGAVGLLLIMIFMIAYYRLLGVVACVALAIYGVIFLGILNAIPVTMTLPGIAGMVLTLGMAVDANVLIFARIRDEVASGKSIQAATSAGFRKAFRAVFDCNMTTVITALVLFATATGGVKGFALTLAIGVILSFLTAVAVTRSMLNLLSRWRPFRSHRLLGLRVPESQMPGGLDAGDRS